jgi:hypothetical protein
MPLYKRLQAIHIESRGLSDEESFKKHPTRLRGDVEELLPPIGPDEERAEKFEMFKAGQMITKLEQCVAAQLAAVVETQILQIRVESS